MAAKIEEANSRLGDDEREMILKERELEKRSKKFIARFSLRIAFMAFRKRVGRQREIKFFAAKCKIAGEKRTTFHLLHRWHDFLRSKKLERTKVRTILIVRVRRVWTFFREAYKIHARSSRHARLRVLRQARFAISHWHNLGKVRAKWSRSTSTPLLTIVARSL